VFALSDGLSNVQARDHLLLPCSLLQAARPILLLNLTRVQLL
jgi:hypothetical protein